ncbi:MAG: chemotaxis response regulator protein-glutamate methylesterase [Micropepsaceae bacterium]
MSAAAAMPRGGPPAPPVRVMLVDDSAVMRGFLRRVLEPETRIQIVGAAANGKEAIELLGPLKPDAVILDIEMPVMDGITALPLMLEAHPGLKVLVASVLSKRNASISLDAMRLGAADYVAKPEKAFAPEVASAYGADLAERIVAITKRGGVTQPQRTEASAVIPAAAPRTTAPSTVAAIAIGSSTGGPPALMQVLGAIQTVTQPIFITQHMPATFTSLLAESLGRLTGRPSAEAVDGEAVQPGRIYVAPAGLHLTVQRVGTKVFVRLNDDPPENYCKPAVDPMFRSLAEAYGRGLLGVVLTGMGSDSAKGCEAIAQKGGRFIAQDEKTSVVWGMPGAAAKTGLADAVVALGDIAAFISRLCGHKS